MRAGLLLASLAFLALLAGCLQPQPQPASETAHAAAAAGVVAFGQAGPALLGNATWGSVATGAEGGEPTLGIDGHGNLFVVALEKTLRSRDQGKTWETVFDFAKAGPIPDRVTSDPYLWVDQGTGRVYTLHMVSVACNYLAWSDDQGATWTGRDGACETPAIDHPKLGSGPAPAGMPLAGKAYPSVLYLCHGRPAVFGEFTCATSLDGGLTFPIASSPFNAANGECSQVGGVLATRSDGAVAVAGGDHCKAVPVAVSQDAGLTWTVRHGPAIGQQSMDADLAFGPDGALWMAWRGTDQLLHLARSADLGAAWEGPWTVSPPGVNTTAFEAVAVRADGRVAAAFLGTRGIGAPGEVPNDARWDLYATVLDPAAPGAFSSVRLSADPVQVGPICYVVQVPCPQGSRNLADFLDAQVAPDGTLYVAYADGCVDACAGSPAPTPSMSRAAATSVAWLRDW